MSVKVNCYWRINMVIVMIKIENKFFIILIVFVEKIFFKVLILLVRWVINLFIGVVLKNFIFRERMCLNKLFLILVVICCLIFFIKKFCIDWNRNCIMMFRVNIIVKVFSFWDNDICWRNS